VDERADPTFDPGATKDDTPLRGRRPADKRYALAFIGCADVAHRDRARLIWLDDVVRVQIGRGESESSVQVAGREVRLTVSDRHVSRGHATLRRARQDWRIQDDGAKNGTFVGGARITDHALRHGDIIETGRCFWRFIEHRPLRADFSPESVDFAPTRTISPPLMEQLERLQRIAVGDKSVLLQGETGTGKELAAKLIHRWSERRGPLQAINSATLSSEVALGDLFGAARGAYTGSDRDRPGHLETAADGTLLLDEIGELPANIQPRLLRVLQDQTFYRLGETKLRTAKARILGATNRDIPSMLETGAFRTALYARFHHTAHLPPLRERIEDMGILIAHYLGTARPADARPMAIEPALYRRLLAYHWPYNVRQLEQVLLDALVAAQDSCSLRLEDLSPLPGEATPSEERPPDQEPDERAFLEAGLTRVGGKVAVLARDMGRSRPYLYTLLRKHGLDPKTFRKRQ